MKEKKPYKGPHNRMGSASFAGMPDQAMIRDFPKSIGMQGAIPEDFVESIEALSGVCENKQRPLEE